MKKSNKIIILTCICAFIILYFIDDIIMISTEKTCAKITGYHKIKNSTYFDYEYLVDGEIVQANKSILFFKVTDFDSLKAMDCIEIEYSKVWNVLNRIIDERVSADEHE